MPGSPPGEEGSWERFLLCYGVIHIKDDDNVLIYFEIKSI